MTEIIRYRAGTKDFKTGFYKGTDRAKTGTIVQDRLNLPCVDALLGTLCISSVNNLVIFLTFFLVFEEPEDPTNRSFFSEIISSISDVKFSNSGRYMISRDYLSVKVWDLHMETKPIETYTVSYFHTIT